MAIRLPLGGTMTEEIARVLVSKEEIDSICTRIAAQINKDYADSDKRLVIVCVLKGSMIFTSDLMRRITVPMELECMKVASYFSSTKSSGEVKLQLDMARSDLTDCDLLIVEDIIDSGRTLYSLINQLRERGARSVRCCTLLDKPSRRVVDLTPDYIGREIPDEFVVGYGLDYDEKYRELPYVGILSPWVYEK